MQTKEEVMHEVCALCGKEVIYPEATYRVKQKGKRSRVCRSCLGELRKKERERIENA